MASITVETKITIVDTESDVKRTDFSSVFSGLTTLQQHEAPVGAAATVTLIDLKNAVAALTGNFDVLILVGDQAFDYEFTADAGDVNEHIWAVRQPADMPLVLGVDDAYAKNGASEGLAGTLDVIEVVKVKGTGTDGTVKMYVGT